MIMGYCIAEQRPVGFQWVVAARERCAKIIHVDPRFTRTSAMSDIWVPLRAGSDILFLGAIINYVLQNNLWFDEYVKHYTNAATLINEDFQDTEDLGGVFSGLEVSDDLQNQYDTTSWLYEGTKQKSKSSGSQHEHAAGHALRGKDRGGEAEEPSKHKQDMTLQHPRCVFQILKKHFARYTPEMVAEVAGVPEEQFLKVARLITENSGRDR